MQEKTDPKGVLRKPLLLSSHHLVQLDVRYPETPGNYGIIIIPENIFKTLHNELNNNNNIFFCQRFFSKNGLKNY